MNQKTAPREAGDRPKKRLLNFYTSNFDQLIEARNRDRAERYRKAEELVRNGLKEYPGHPMLEWRLALLSNRAGRTAAAKKRMVRVVRSNHAGFDAQFFVVGAMLGRESRDRSYEMSMIREGLKRFPLFPELRFRLGQVHAGQNEFAKALPHLEVAVNLDPHRPSKRRALALALGKLGQVDRAERVLGHLSERCSGSQRCGTLLELGVLQQSQQRYAEAEASYRSALRSEQRSSIYSNLCSVLRQTERFDESRTAFRHALVREPESASAWYNLGNLERDAGRLVDAMACYDHALRIDPDQPGFHWNRSQVLLGQGRLAEGFEGYEWRWRDPGSGARHPEFRRPAWDGSALAGRTLLLRAEQSMADHIHFARFLPAVAASGGPVILECHPPLQRLFGRVPDGVQVVEPGSVQRDVGVQLPLPSAARALGVTTEDDIQGSPWLDLPGDWQFEVPELGQSDGRRRIGLVWADTWNPDGDRRYSMPVEAIRPIAARTDIRLFALQPGEVPAGVTGLGERFGDLCDVGSVLRQLDLVITVDATIARLAGALGVPFWVLLGQACDWPWMEERPQNPWYPTARVFRQARPGDWAGVIEAVGAALGKSGRSAADEVFSPPASGAIVQPAPGA